MGVDHRLVLREDPVVRHGPVGRPRALALHAHGGRGRDDNRDGGHAVPLGGGDQRRPGLAADIRCVDDREQPTGHPPLQEQVQGVDRVGGRLLVTRVVTHRFT